MGKQRSDGEARASRRAGTGPTYPPPQPGGLSPVLERNLGWVPVVPVWDPSFVVLAMVAAVEAIFLTFLLVSPEPHGRGGGQAGQPRPAGQPAHGARDHPARHAGVGDRRPDGGQDEAEAPPTWGDRCGRRPEAVLDELEAAEAEAEQP